MAELSTFCAKTHYANASNGIAGGNRILWQDKDLIKIMIM